MTGKDHSDGLTDLRYPIGRFQPPAEIDRAQRVAWLETLESLPTDLRQATTGLNDKQLETPYRPDGWTVRQVVHHVADSHMNSYVRFRLALTEQSPVIKPYDEAAWAQLDDAKSAPLELSLALLEGVHARWVRLLRSLQEPDFARTFQHPEQGSVRLDYALGLYAWHCRHHLAHIEQTRVREGW